MKLQNGLRVRLFQFLTIPPRIPVPRIILYTSILFATSSCIQNAALNPPGQQAVRGRIDLRDFNFKERIANLSGEWGFRYGASRAECQGLNRGISSRKKSRSRIQIVSTPGYWFSYTVNGRRLPVTGQGCYQLTILLAPDRIGVPLEFFLNDINAASELYWNGYPLVFKGRVGNSAADEIPDITGSMIAIPIEKMKEENRLTVLISNYHMRGGGITGELLLGETKSIHEHMMANHLADFFLLGSIWMAGMYYLALWFGRRREKSYLWFFLFCVVVSVRLLASSSYLEFIYPVPWMGPVRMYLEYMTAFCLAGIAFAIFLYYYFANIPYRYPLYFILATSVLCGLVITWYHDASRYGAFHLYFSITLVLNLFLLVPIFILSIIRRESGSTLLFMMFMFMIGLIFHDLYITTNALIGRLYSPTGLFLFIYGLAAILGRKFNAAHEELEHLSHKQLDTQEELRRSEQLFRTTIENAPLIILALDEEANITLAYGKELLELGITPQDTIGLNFVQAIGETAPEAVAAFYRSQQGETPALKQEFRGCLFEVKFSPLYERSGNIGGSVCVALNITDQFHLEEQLRQTQKMEIAGRLAGGIAHDFNNLLSIITLNVSMLIERFCEDEFEYGILQTIDRTADRAANLTNRLLAFSRKQIVQPELIELDRLIEDMAKIIRPLIGENIELDYYFGSGPFDVRADINQMEQILLNLAVNARDAMPGGGSLTFELGRFRPDDEFLRTRSDARDVPYVNLVVRDSGEGMDPETALKIFEPFFTTKDVGKGTGLGLATVYGTVKQNGGLIEVESELHVGTAFQIYLPLEEQAAALPFPEHLDEPRRLTPKKILLIEEHDDLRESLKLLLNRSGLEVQDFRYTDDIFRDPEGPPEFQVLIANPDNAGKKEIEHYEKVLQACPDAIVLYLTAYSGSDWNPELPAGEQIQKPFRPDELVQKLHSILEVGKA